MQNPVTRKIAGTTLNNDVPAGAGGANPNIVATFMVYDHGVQLITLASPDCRRVSRGSVLYAQRTGPGRGPARRRHDGRARDTRWAPLRGPARRTVAWAPSRWKRLRRPWGARQNLRQERSERGDDRRRVARGSGAARALLRPAQGRGAAQCNAISLYVAYQPYSLQSRVE